MNKSGTKADIIDSLRKTNFRIKKHLGQNFLADANILDKIVATSGIDKSLNVIEIGPGFGALTERLAEHSGKILAYEIDPELVGILKDKLKDITNLTLVQKDILKADIDKDIQTTFGPGEKAVVVSNLPYYITTPILMHILETARNVTRIVVMMQQEVAMRITSRPNTKDYNALSVAIAYRTEAKLLFHVPKSVFIPAPNVDSAVVELTVRQKHTHAPRDEARFFKFVRSCFAQRRKTLANNLLAAYPGLNRSQVEANLFRAGLDPSIRAEALDLDTFIALSDLFNEAVENRG